MDMQKKRNERNISLDIIRIIAVLLVIMIHTSDGFVTQHKPSSREFAAGNVFDSVAMIAVPLFVMLSGALMLDEERTITVKGLFRKNIRNILLLLVFWSTVYSLVYNLLLPLVHGKTLSLRTILMDVITGHFHMWYLYMILGLYLITPFLRAFTKRGDKKLVLFFISISLCTQFLLPLINMFSLLSGELKHMYRYVTMCYLQFFGGYAAYYLAGWYIVHVGISQRAKRMVVYGVGLVSLLTAFLYVRFTGDYEMGYYNMSLFSFAYTVSLFLAVSRLRIKAGDKVRKVLAALSKMTFGVYILHPLFMDLVDRVMPYTGMPVLYIMGYFVAVTVLSFAGCYVVSKIPILKRSVRM